MSSWTLRVVAENIPQHPIPVPPSAAQPSARGGDSRFPGTEADSLEQENNSTPTRQSRNSTRVSPGNNTTEVRNRAGHGRSMSLPFSTLASGKKKRHADNTTTGHDLTDDETSTPARASVSPLKAGKGKTVRILDKDLTTGKCMTCDSTVRWPKELNVYRCTICLTINDLKPVRSDLKRGVGRRAYDFINGRLSPDPAAQAEDLSLQRTTAIIEQCIVSYLLDRMHHSGERDSDQERSDDHAKSAPGLAVPIPHRSAPTHRPSDEVQNDPEFVQRLYSSSSPEFSHCPTILEVLRSANETEDLNPPSRTPIPPQDLVNLGSRELRNSSRLPRERGDPAKNMFRPLQDYITASFASHETVNSSFTMTSRPELHTQASSEGANRRAPRIEAQKRIDSDNNLSNLDAKTLLIGNFAENGSWWTGESEISKMREWSPTRRNRSPNDGHSELDIVNARSPNINWGELHDWYRQVIFTGHNWKHQLNDLIRDTGELAGWRPSGREMLDIEEQIHEAETHTQRVLLKATETLLKRPGGYLRNPDEIRFLLIILANPLLYSPAARISKTISRSESNSRGAAQNLRVIDSPRQGKAPSTVSPSPQHGAGSGHHSGIIKRVLGLLSNLPNECHHHLVAWFARFPETQFQKTTDLVGSFVTYRLTRQHGREKEGNVDLTGGLIPTISVLGRRGSAALHAAIGVPGQSYKQTDGKPKAVVYNDDWQIKAAARVMALLFSANNAGIFRKSNRKPPISEDGFHSAGLLALERAQRRGQILSTSNFYNSLLDLSDLIADFEAWESKRGKFSFCQYPFFLSIWAKIQIMEHDARRQMEIKAREAFFDSIMTRKAVHQYLVLRVRRECLVEDSLKGVSEVVGNAGEEIKKGLRIEFKGEEGIDAGGLRKEWFLLLVRDIFNPDHGMFIYDDDSQACYFNPNSFETSDQYFLVGVLFGLAIYNSTILDVALPPFTFRKLLASAPTATSGAPSHTRLTMVYTLEDLYELRPALANGLKQLLEFDGDVEGTFCRDFVADVERYGQVLQIPLCPGGEKKPVNNANRREFVDLYVRYLLDTAVARQFEPFKRGFFTVCGGNALSLFRPEEIELLIRGSDEPLDILSLEAVSICENWGVSNPAESEPVIGWFWKTFRDAEPRDQRKLLSFITGSDRIPAMGAANLVIKLSCLGDDSPRFPVARTCFNQLSLYRYLSCQKLEMILWRAVNESEGFGLK